jgi:hypothetical protein
MIFFFFLLKAKRNKSFKAWKEISATLRSAEPWSGLALHAPFPPCRTGFPFAETQLRAARHYPPEADVSFLARLPFFSAKRTGLIFR